MFKIDKYKKFRCRMGEEEGDLSVKDYRVCGREERGGWCLEG